MSTETNKATVRRYVEQVMGAGRANLIDEFMVESIALHGTGLEPGLPALGQWVAMLDSAFPDRQLTVDDVVAEGDRVVARVTMRGTHQGEMQGIPATGKAINQSSITIFRLANGKIAEGWFAADNLSLMQQLGVIPALQAA
ncbi:MAG: ester cyclase [Chloroflexota bacterium]|nr:MAG: ester cyclase [Chloroflexota bacterium]